MATSRGTAATRDRRRTRTHERAAGSAARKRASATASAKPSPGRRPGHLDSSRKKRAPAPSPQGRARTPRRNGGAPVIQVHNLKKTYRDGTEAAKGVSFHVQEGEIFGLLGPNGAGKTTIMRILGTLHPATAGRATVLGLDVERQAAELRTRIGFAMQEVGMDDLATAREMLEFHARLHGLSKQEARRRSRDLLKTFELEAHADRRVMRFSGGMQRRLDLAVSIIHEPEVLFLDEPSTGLDPTSRADLWKILRRLRDENGLTVLMSTHYMDEADALCDRIAIMSEGRIAAVDVPEALKRSVGADTIRVDLSAPPTSGQLQRLQRALGDAELDAYDGYLQVSVADGSKQLLPVLSQVADAGLQVAATKVLTPSLDDVFLQYTGVRLAEGDEPGDDEAARLAAAGHAGGHGA